MKNAIGGMKKGVNFAIRDVMKNAIGGIMKSVNLL